MTVAALLTQTTMREDRNGTRTRRACDDIASRFADVDRRERSDGDSRPSFTSVDVRAQACHAGLSSHMLRHSISCIGAGLGRTDLGLNE